MSHSGKIILVVGLLLLPLFVPRFSRTALMKSGSPVAHSQPRLLRPVAIEPLGPLPHDLKSQLSYAATLPFEDRAALLQGVVDAIAENAFSDAFFLLVPGTTNEIEKELRMRMLQRWSEFNPQAASEAVVLLQPKECSDAISRVASVWARTSFDEALIWAQNLSTHREAALLAIASEAASREPTAALALLKQIPDSKERAGILTRAISEWANIDPKAAMVWAEKQEDWAVALSAVATSLADTDPMAAAKMLITKTERSPAQENAIMGILQRFARRDADAAKKWASEFPEELRGPALLEIQRISERQISRR